MDPEKDSNSSFEDLSNINENDLKESTPSTTPVKETADSTQPTDADAVEKDDGIVDVIGNGQLIKKIIVRATTDIQPQRGNVCNINYKGFLEDGTLVEEATKMTIQVGDCEVAQGLDMAIPLMRVGETAEIACDARFAYGTIGRRSVDKFPAIQPGAKVTYTVELLDCEDEEDIDVKSFEARKTIGNRKRERGNFFYERGEFNQAIQIYRRALEYLDEVSGGSYLDPPPVELSNSQLQELLEDRVKVNNNLAAAQMKISAYEAALKAVDNVLRCQPQNVKALFRKGKILDAKGDTKAAIPVLQKAATLDPESKAIQQELGKLIMKSRREARNEKDMYQKMLGHAQRMDEKNQKKAKPTDVQETAKLKLWGYLMGSILIGVAGVAMYRYKYF